jgi:hypothetical protein
MASVMFVSSDELQTPGALLATAWLRMANGSSVRRFPPSSKNGAELRERHDGDGAHVESSRAERQFQRIALGT